MEKTIIIAEAGVNHNGDMALARQLVDAAADAGADYVKFQTFRTEELISKNTALAEYQKKNIGRENGDQFDMLKKLELTETDHLELIDYCRKRGISFLSTAFDMESLKFLHSLRLDYWKIPSGEITNYPYLKAVAQYGGKVIMSTGMCSITDISDAIDVLTRFGLKREDISLLHCNTEYPTPLQDVNLNAMVEMRREFDLATGYSDHTKGIEVPVAAVALGATIIEKHFTLDRNMYGPDHAASLEPDELKTMVSIVRNVEKALGSASKIITESERKNILIARKSIVASVNISEGDTFSEENLCVKRPGTGISPMRWEEVLGRKAKRNFKPDEQIEI